MRLDNEKTVVDEDRRVSAPEERVVTLLLPTGLPDGSGKPKLEAHDLSWTGESLDKYLSRLEISLSQVQHCVYNGRVLTPEQKLHYVPVEEKFFEKIIRKLRRKPQPVKAVSDRSEIESCVPNAGDTIIVLPNVEGKNAAYILGAVGAVIGFWLGGGGGAAAGWKFGMAAVQGAMLGFSIGSTIGAFFTPKPKLNEEADGIETHLWSSIGNDDRAGVPIPVIMGERRVGGIRIGSYITRSNYDEYLNILILLGHGEVEEIGDIEAEGRPLSDFTRAQYEVRTGTDTQTVIPEFNAIRNTYQNNPVVELETVPYTYQTQTEVDAFELLYTIPGLFKVEKDGKQKKNETVFSYRYRAVGGAWSDWIEEERSASQRSTLLATVRVENLPKAYYDIETKWISADSTDEERAAWKVFLTGITEEEQRSLSYDGYALLGVKMLPAEDFGGRLPTLTARVKGLKIQPWNGASFDPPVWTQNRAWITLEIFRNEVWGAGRRLRDYDVSDRNQPAAWPHIDLNSFRQWALWNDEQVEVTPDTGAPYFEDRDHCDLVLDASNQFIDVVQEVASAGNAALSVSQGKWKVIPDRDDTPVQMFTMGNIIRSSFSISYQRETETNTFQVQYPDQDNNWETDNVTLVSRDLVELGGEVEKPSNLQLPGVCRRSQIFRDTKLRLRKIAGTRRLITFQASTDAILIEVGDIFYFQHELPQWGYGGRVMDGSDSSRIWLDTAFPMTGGQSYQIRIRPSDGSNEAGEVKDIVNPAPLGEEYIVQEIELTTPLSFTPEAGDLYAAGPVNIESKPYRCLQIDRNDDNIRTLTATEHIAIIYDLDSDLTIPIYSLLPDYGAPPAPITDAKVYEEVSWQLDESFLSTIILQWNKPSSNYIPPPPDGSVEVGTPQTRRWGAYEGAIIERSWNGTNWEKIAATSGGVTEWRWEGAPQGTALWFRVTPYSRGGKVNYNGTKEAVPAPLITSGKTDDPPAVANFRASVVDNQYVFEWDEIQRILLYEIRKSATGAWGTSRDIAGTVTAYTPATTSTDGLITIGGETLAIRQGTSISGEANLIIGQVATLYHNLTPEGDLIGPAEADSGNTHLTRGLVWRGIDQTFSFVPINDPARLLHGRNQTLFIKSIDAFGNTSFGAVSTSLNDVPPTAPSIDSITRTKNTLKLKVSPPASGTDNDLVAIHLHASDVPGFTPSDANRVAQVVGPRGGEFNFTLPPEESGIWYFKATAEDWLSERFDDWVYSGESSAQLLVIVPSAPSSVGLVTVPAQGFKPKIVGVDPDITGPDGTPDFTARDLDDVMITWNHPGVESNPPNSLVGFQVVVIDGSVVDIAAELNDPALDSGVMAQPDRRTTRFKSPILDLETAIAAVRAVYTDGINSPFVTSTGETIGGDPGTTLTELIQDRFGRFELPDTASDFFSFDKNTYGVRGTRPLSGRDQSYTLTGEGVAIEQPATNKLPTDMLDPLAPWTVVGGTLTDVTADAPEPIRGDWKVFRLTKTGAAGDMYVYRTTSGFGTLSGKKISASAWVKNESSHDADFHPYLWNGKSAGLSVTAGHLLQPIPAGVWRRMFTNPVTWPTDTSTDVILVVRTQTMNVGDSILVTAPNVVESAVPHEPLQYQESMANGIVQLPPLATASKQWTLLFRAKRQPKTSSTAIMWAIYPSGSDVSEIRLTLTGINALQLVGTSVPDATSDAFNEAGSSEWVSVAVRRDGNTFSVFSAGDLISEATDVSDPTAGVSIDRMALGGVGSPPNMKFRNMVVFSVALSNEDIRAISKQGVRFALPDPKIVIPVPSSVTIEDITAG